MIVKNMRTICLSLLVCSTLFLYGCQTTVFTDISESSANEIVAFLDGKGIVAQKQPGQAGLFSVLVDEVDFGASVQMLEAEGLPRASYDSLGNVFKKEGVVSTPLEENARLIFALSQEVAGSIALINGVLDARVHVVLPTTDAFGNTSAPSSASIFIKHRHDASIENEVARIKQLVEKSIQNLKYENISVFLFAAPAVKNASPTQFKTVLGIKVAPSSVGLIWALIGLIIVLLCTTLGFWAWPRYMKNKG